MDTQKTPSWGEVARSLAIIAVTVGAAYVVTDMIGLESLREHVASAGVWAPLILVALKATTIVAAPLSGSIVYAVAGAAFGFWPGLALSLVGDTLGSSIAFLISRYFGRSVLHFFTSESQRPVIDQVLASFADTKSFVKARIYFAGYMDLFAYAAGLTPVSFWLFIAVHMIVHAPVAALYVLFGNLIVSGAWYIIVPMALASMALAAFGAWRFHLDLNKNA